MLHKQLRTTVPLRRVGTMSFLVGAYSIVAVLSSRQTLIVPPTFPSGLDAVLSAAMALIIAFRVNRAYERWWEARSLWGKLVNVSRNLAIKIRELQRPDITDRQRTRNLIVAFCVGLKNHLHGESDLRVLPGFTDEPAQPRHVPSFVARRLYGLLKTWKTEHKLSDQELWILDAEARELMEVAGGCEKIKHTLISISWRNFTGQCIAVYLFVLPWGLVDEFGMWSVPLATLTTYFVIAAEGIARFVEEPFGVHEDHLDLESICTGIERSVSEVLLDT